MVLSLPYGHSLLSKICQIKKAYLKIHKVIEQEKNSLLKLEKEAVEKHKRLRILKSINQPKPYYKLDSNVKVNQNGSFDFKTTRDDILSSKWLHNTVIHLH